MAYLGRGIENLSDRVVLDSLTASATASYTLQLNSVNFVPSSAESLTVSLNGVIQAPISSYTVSGSTLTFASALTSSDSIDFIIAERGITLQTPSAGSVGTSQLASTAVTTAKIADDAVTKDKLLSHNYPAFEALLGSNQSISNNTQTKVQFGTENFDTDNCYDNSTNYRFTPTTSGKYFIYSTLTINNGQNVGIAGHLVIKKNGSSVFLTQTNVFNNTVINAVSVSACSILTLNGSSDYVEIFGLGENSSGTPTFLGTSTGQCIFGAYRIGD